LRNETVSKQVRFDLSGGHLVPYDEGGHVVQTSGAPGLVSASAQEYPRVVGAARVSLRGGGRLVYARTVTFDSNEENVGAGLAFARDEVLEQVTAMPGCLGMSVVADSGGGLCISTSAWESEAAMRAGDDSVTALRRRAAELFGATPVEEEWEVAVMRRMRPIGDRACARATWLASDPDGVDRNIEVFRTTTLPAVEQFDGVCSASLLVDRAAGRVVATFAYADAAVLGETRERAEALRSQTSTEMAAGVQDVREFDVVLAHLHVPDLG
jgi:heme-degrading monooxygenase HmoA